MHTVDIKSRAKLPLTVNLRDTDHGGAFQGQVVQRVMTVKDKVAGQDRAKVVEISCPAVVRWPAGGVVKGLPASVLTHPVIKSMLSRLPGRRPKLIVVAEYKTESEEKPKEAAPVEKAPATETQPQAAKAKIRGRGRRK